MWWRVQVESGTGTHWLVVYILPWQSTLVPEMALPSASHKLEIKYNDFSEGGLKSCVGPVGAVEHCDPLPMAAFHGNVLSAWHRSRFSLLWLLQTLFCELGFVPGLIPRASSLHLSLLFSVSSIVSLWLAIYCDFTATGREMRAAHPQSYSFKSCLDRPCPLEVSAVKGNVLYLRCPVIQ